MGPVVVRCLDEEDTLDTSSTARDDRVGEQQGETWALLQD